MNNRYEINQSSKIKYFYKIQITTFFIHLLGLIGLVYFKNITEFNVIKILSIAIFFSWLVFFALPVFLLYFNHKKNSKKVVLIEDDSNFIYSNEENSITFSMEDVKKVELWLTPTAYDKRIDFLYFGKYHFTRIYIKENKIINLSCLVFDKTKEVFPEELIKRKKKFFPFMKKNEI